MLKSLRFKYVLIILMTFACVIVGSYYFVELTASNHIYDTIDETPYHVVGVVPGTSQYISNGLPNVFFTERINSAAAIYTAGKVSRILISGDNGQDTYNEPEDMQTALIAAGVPKEHITLDYAGFSTLDTVIRANKVFGQQDILFISQEFQNKRAIAIGKKYNMNIDGFNTRTIPFTQAPRIYIREVLARTKMLFDIYVLHTEPTFLGESITIQ